MKKINFKFSKRTIIILTIVVSLMGATSIMAQGQMKKPKVSNVEVNSSLPVNKKTDNNVEVTLVPEEATQNEPETTTESSSAPQQPVGSEQPQEGVAAPVRTFEEIILSYPNMSGTDREVVCSMLMLRLYPEKFTEDVREKNVKMVADVFASSCSPFMNIQGDLSQATDSVKRSDLLHDRGSGDFWQLRG